MVLVLGWELASAQEQALVEESVEALAASRAVLALGWELASAQEQALVEESVEALAASRARGWALPMASA